MLINFDSLIQAFHHIIIDVHVAYIYNLAQCLNNEQTNNYY